MERLSVKGGG